MKYLIGSLAILLMLNQVGILSPAAAASSRRRQAPPPKPKVLEPAAKALKEMTVESLSKWMTYYYLKPEPETLVAALLLQISRGFCKEARQRHCRHLPAEYLQSMRIRLTIGLPDSDP